MPPKLPLPRGWKRRVRSSALSQSSTIDRPLFKRPESLTQYTRVRKSAPYGQYRVE